MAREEMVTSIVQNHRTFQRNMLVFFWIFFVPTASAFNLDLDSVIKYHGPPDSMFGFSVTEHKERGHNWVVIGAPEMSVHLNKIPNYRGGAVYYCDAGMNDGCNMIPIENFKYDPNFSQAQNITSQWLGATVRSSGEDGVLLICAPRYFWFKGNNNGETYREPVGTCFISNTSNPNSRVFQDFSEYSPCRMARHGSQKRHGYCQAGFGADLSKGNASNVRAYIGAPGSYYWQGQLIARNVYNEQFQVTLEGPNVTDDSYMGYSVSSMEFISSNSKIAGVVTGVPRGEKMMGKIRLMNWNLTDLKSIIGEQFASHFGYSVCVADVDGNGADDIIVGAPMFSYYNPNKIDYETGRVYVYYQTIQSCNIDDSACWDKKFSKNDFIDGEQSKSRFGLSVAFLGDINQDGYQDFAVGAPYEGSFSGCGNGRSDVTGAVYIYHGSKSGVRKKYSQVIRASQMGSHLATFGFSLSGGMDLDRNSYPDLVVGAYESHTVFLFKSRPVIQLEANMTFQSTSKMIELNKPTCRISNNVNVPCVTLHYCFVYDGVGVQNSINLAYEITLDAKQTSAPRMYFKNQEGRNIFTDVIPLTKRGILCRTLETYVAPLGPTEDRLSPFEAELKYKLNYIYSPGGTLTPVLNVDDEYPPMRKDSMTIKNNCGDDNVCKPNLLMNVDRSVENYILGSGPLIFNVTVKNTEEDSFGTVFKLQIPYGINYSRFEDQSSVKSEFNVQCYPPRSENNHTISCDIGNPLPRTREVKFSVILEPNTVVEDSNFNFKFDVSSSNPVMSSKWKNQTREISVPILEQTSLQINGVSSQTYYNASQYEYDKIETDTQAGPSLRHEYTIKNLGPSDILEADVVFDWPARISTGEDLLYLLSQPITEGNIKCQPVSSVNEKKLQIRRKFNDSNTENSKTEIASTSKFIGTNKYSNSGSSINQFNQETSKQQNTGSSFRPSGGPSQASSKESYYHQQTQQNHFLGSSQGSNQQGNFHGSGVQQQGSVQFGSGNMNKQTFGSQQGSTHKETHVIHQQEVNTYPGGSFGLSGTNQQNNVHGSSASFGSNTQGGFQQGGSFGSSNTQKGWYDSQGWHSGYENESHQQGSGFQHGGGIKGTKGVESFHEVETAYSKNTVNENGKENTVVEGKWRTNDNGIVQNGSFSSGHPVSGYDKNQHLIPGTFFDEQNVPRYNSGLSSNGYDMNVNTHTHSVSGGVGSGLIRGKPGTIIHRQQLGNNSTLTVYDEGLYREPTKVLIKGNETENVYHYKSAEQKTVKPILLPNNVFLSKERRLEGQNVPEYINEKRPPLHHSSQNNLPEGDDEMETGDGGSEDDETNEEDEVEESDLVDHHRSKRAAVTTENSRDFCTVSSCVKVTCKINRLAKNEEVSVIFPAVVWAKTIKKIAFNRPVEIGSYVEVNITKMPHLKTPKVNVTYSAEILTNITSIDYEKTAPDVIPLWVVVSSAVLGALILMLLVFLLYKSGFFKRNRPPPIPERQPLNRNGDGYHMGDEAL